MQTHQSALAPQIETVAELRALYRASEARGARLRLMSSAARQLALAEAGTIDAILAQCVSQLAYFLGRRSGVMHYGTQGPCGHDDGLPIPAPGPGERMIGRIEIEGVVGLSDIADDEDMQAVRMLLEMMGGTLDRISREEQHLQLLHTLRDREARLEKVVGQVLIVQEEERRRVSHDLHDGVAQTATALMRRLEGEGAAKPADIPAADRAQLAAMARDLVNELRGVIRGLRPTILDDLGLEAGISALVEAMEADGYCVSAFIANTGAIWTSEEETALYRVAQEALANIRKHGGGPCDVIVELTTDPHAPFRSLRIGNARSGNRAVAHGAETAKDNHFGIDIMRERMSSVGGTLSWDMAEDGSVTVLAQWPPQARAQ